MSDTPQTSKHRPFRPLIGVAVVVLLGLLATAGFKSYRDLAAARAHESELEHDIAATEARIRALREHVRRIEEDPHTLERLAREELGLVKPGDVVIVLPDAPPPPRSTAEP